MRQDETKTKRDRTLAIPPDAVEVRLQQKVQAKPNDLDVVGPAGVAAGWAAADPVVGLVITVAILAVLWTAMRDIFGRLMAAVDPSLVDAAEHTLQAIPGVVAVRRVRMRWIGHEIHADADLDIDARHPHTQLGPLRASNKVHNGCQGFSQRRSERVS